MSMPMPAVPLFASLSTGATPTPHVAYVELRGWTPEPAAGEDDEVWLAACYWITSRLERVSATRALLDLGSCTDGEATAVAASLLQRLTTLGKERARVRIGIGTNALCAQLALLAPHWEEKPAVRVLAAEAAPKIVRALPVRWLPALHPAGVVTHETAARLEGYGLRTLGQVARLGEDALRRQFGDRLGATLAAVAAGHDPRPLVPTSQPAALRCRLTFTAAAHGASPQRVLAALVPAAERIARRLAAEGRQTRRLRLALTWQAGGVSAGQVRLRTPTADARQLAQRLSDLCGTLLLAGAESVIGPDAEGAGADGVHPGAREAIMARAGSPSAAAAAAAASLAPVTQLIERALVEVGDLVPLAPEQAVFWQTRARRWAAIDQVAETLARRFGRPRLVRARCATPDAIFPAERYRLLPLGTVEGTEEPDSSTSRRQWRDAAEHRPAAATPWERVPHRLHWW